MTQEIPKEEGDQAPDTSNEVKGKWAQHRKVKAKQKSIVANSLKQASRLYSKSTSDLTEGSDLKGPDFAWSPSKDETKAKGVKKGFMDTGPKGSLEYESSPYIKKHQKDKSHMLRYSHFNSPSYGSDLSISQRSETSGSANQRLTSQNYVNPYSSSPTAEIQGIKKPWKKPKAKSRLFEYSTDFGYMSPLRVVQSTEDLSLHLKSKSGNPYIDTHNEIMVKMTHSSARGPRRYRPKSVSDQIKSVLGIQSLSATPQDFERGRTAPDDDPLKRLNHAQKMYSRKSNSSANMMAALRTRLNSRGKY